MHIVLQSGCLTQSRKAGAVTIRLECAYSVLSDCRDIPEDVLNTYCWIHSTYTVVDAFTKKQGSEVPFPGIDNSLGHRGAPLTIRHTKYYQWVAFTLFFQVSLIFVCFINEAKSKVSNEKLSGENGTKTFDYGNKQLSYTIKRQVYRIQEMAFEVCLQTNCIAFDVGLCPHYIDDNDNSLKQFHHKAYFVCYFLRRLTSA